MNSQKKLGHYLRVLLDQSPRPARYLVSSDKPATLGKARWRIRHEAILPRQNYLFGHFDFSNVPPANRHAALKLHLTTWSPFAKPSYYIGWADGCAMVWCWDTERLQQMLGSGKNQLRIIPETLLYPKADDSIRLLQVSDGYEIQHWKANHLRHSQGYRAYPTTAEWLLFQRESGTPLDKQRPLPEQALQFEWNKHPWLKNTGETGVQPRGVLLEYILGTLTVALLAGTTAWLATQSLYLTQEISSRDTHLKSLEQTLRPLREARQSAMGALARSKELSRLDPYPDQFVILGKLANLLPQNTGTYIREWEYQSGKLKLTLSVSNASAQLQEFIDALQNSEGFFQNIVGTAATDGKSMVLELDISPQSDPK